MPNKTDKLGFNVWLENNHYKKCDACIAACKEASWSEPDD